MDPYTLGGMIFSLIMVLIIGGFIVTFPIVRRLGGLMEEYIRERRDTRLDRGELGRVEGELQHVREALETLRRQLDLVQERQDFMEELVERPDPARLASGHRDPARAD